MKYTGSNGLSKIFQLIKSKFEGLAKVASSGSYNDLSDTPSVQEFINITAADYAALVAAGTDREDAYYVILDEEAETLDPLFNILNNHTHEASSISAGTFGGQMVVPPNTNYTTKQLRNVIISTESPSGGSEGDIWIKYTP